MISLPPSVRIFLATKRTDMRKGHDGLAALVQQQMGQDVFTGHLFVFVSRGGNRIKILTWDRGGFVLWYKRLERGRFRLPSVTEDEPVLQLESSELSMLVDGIDFSRVRKPLRWNPKRDLRVVKEKAVSQDKSVFHSGR